MTRLVVLAVAALAAVAVADAFRSNARDARIARPPAAARATVQTLVGGKAAGFREDGPYLQTRVLEPGGREYLSAEAIEQAFPVPVEGPLDISDVAVAPDGTLVVAVYRFPAYGRARGALELWRDGKLVAAFAVPTGFLGGGLRFSRDGQLVGTLSRDGRLTVLDRRGRLVSAPA